MLLQTHGYASRVQFRLACSKIPKDVIMLEIGPHALMRSPLRQNRSDLQYVATMKKGESAVDTLKAAIADLWRKGASITWSTPATPSPSATPERTPLSHPSPNILSLSKTINTYWCMLCPGVLQMHCRACSRKFCA